MGGLPRHLSKAWWGTERAVPIVHALDALFEQMDRQLGGEPPEVVWLAGYLMPLNTGLLPLDSVLGGGIGRGTVALVEADIKAQGEALLNTVARNAPHRCLVDGHDFFALVAGLLAGAAGVPRVNVTDARLSEDEWASVRSGLEQLRDMDVLVSSAGSISALSEIAVATDVDILVIHDLDRFGPPIYLVPELAELAIVCGAAVLASTGPLGDLGDWATDGVVQVGMYGFGLGGQASLVRPDPDDLLAVAQVEVECLHGTVR